MIRFLFSIAVLTFFWQGADAQHKPAYQLFTSEGEKTDYYQLLEAVEEADVVFFGEFHDNPICHWLQRELMIDFYDLKGDQLVVGAEFFEADDQLKIDEYLSGWISENNFHKEARFWNNYDTDYKPLLEYARENGIPFVATNVPRRYANLTFREGINALDSLPEASLEYIAPLPFEVDFDLRTYKMMAEMAHGEGVETFVYAQAIKDVTMAYFIDQSLGEGQAFYHINGSFHSNYREGIVWYLERFRPELKIVVIGSVMEEKGDEWNEENSGLADFILSIPERMTRTY